jgi:hypothetical protein
MTGRPPTSWSSLHRIAVPAMLVTAEATWASILLSAAFNSSPGPHVRLPFLALALPAALAVAWMAAILRLRWRWWWKAPVVGIGAAAGLALTAGVIGELSRSGSWWSTATEPWSATGHAAAVTAGVAWFAATLAWARGLWLGAAPQSFRHVAWSLGLGALAFIGIFAGRGDHQAAAFLANTSKAGWLFFVFFPLTAAAAALVRERQLEETWLNRSGTPPGLVWASVLALPMVGIGLIALLLAVIVGPGAPIVGRGVARAAEAVGAAVVAAVRWLAHLVPRSHPRPAQPLPGAPAHTPQAPRLHSAVPVHSYVTVPTVVWLILAALAALGVVYFLIRNVPGRLKWRSSLPDEEVDEERSSLFSWRHLFSQLRAALWRWPWRRRLPAGPGPRPATESAADEAAMASVRQSYRQLLVTARATGRGRRISETAHELEGRLSVELTPAPVDALRGLTFLYDGVRYGARPASESADTAAAVQSDTVRAALQEMASEAAQPGP